jgi:sigma-B regulation protein RsbU (phosphoserine phosphatase)
MSHSLLAASLITQAPDLFSGDVRVSLRADAVYLTLGTVLSVLGLLSLGIHLLRKKTNERGLLWFGVFTALYGIRMIVSADVFRFAATADPLQRHLWRYPDQALTYVLPLLGALFLREVFPEWGTKIPRFVFWLLGGFAGVAIATDLILHRPGSLHTVNNAIVIGGFVALLVALPRHSSGRFRGSLRIAGVVYVTSVLVENLWSFYGSSDSVSAILETIEPLAFTGFLAVLGAVVVSRIFEREEQLIEVHKELEIAQRIQAAILPRELPSSASVKMAARYLAMTAVAGDFYDFLLPGGNTVGVLIADVSGHGVPAALIASMVKVAIAAQLPHADDPAQVLSGMNRVLCGKMQGQFVSAAYLFLDMGNGLLRYAAAGHPPLLQHAGDAIESISENGMPLGLFAHAAYTAVERPLLPGSRFLLYTDGLIEASDAADEFFGDERVRETLRHGKDFTPEQMATLCVDRVTAWSGSPQQDDLTVIVVDVAG